MRRDSKADIKRAKIEARQRYMERQIDHWVKWSIRVKGKVKYKELLETIEELKDSYIKRKAYE